jgi:hypothetical protein
VLNGGPFHAWTHAAHAPHNASHQLTPPKPGARLPTNCGTRGKGMSRLAGRRQVGGDVVMGQAAGSRTPGLLRPPSVSTSDSPHPPCATTSFELPAHWRAKLDEQRRERDAARAKQRQGRPGRTTRRTSRPTPRRSTTPGARHTCDPCGQCRAAVVPARPRSRRVACYARTSTAARPTCTRRPTTASWRSGKWSASTSERPTVGTHRHGLHSPALNAPPAASLPSRSSISFSMITPRQGPDQRPPAALY